MRIPSGTTNRYIYFVAVDSTDLKTRETGLSGFTVYRSRNGAAAAAMSSPTVNETDSSNMPGVYELLCDEDTTLGAGNDAEEMVFHITKTGMAPVTRTIELYRPETTEGSTLAVADVASVLADTNELQGDWANGGRLDLIVDGILADTAVIGAAGAGLSAVPWNSAWDAEVQSECTDALNAYDPPTKTEMDSAFSTTNGKIDTVDDFLDTEVAAILADTNELQGDWANGGRLDLLIDSIISKVDVVDGICDSILVDTAEIGAAGAGLTAVPWNSSWDSEVQSECADALTAYDPPTKTEMDSAFSTTNGKIDVVDSIVDSILVDTAEIGSAGAGLTGIPWNSSWDAEVQSECNDALVALHLDHLLSVDYDPASKPGTATALLNELVENDSGVSRFTSNALEQGPSGSGGGGDATEAKQDQIIAAVITNAAGTDVAADIIAIKAETATIVADTNELQTDNVPGLISALNDPTAAAISDAVWDEATSGHTSAGTYGKAVGDGITSWVTATGFSTHTAANVRTEMDSNSTQLAAIVADTNELQTDDYPASFTTINTKLDTIDNFLDTEVAAILADTNELQGDWANGGRLDLLVDSAITKLDTLIADSPNNPVKNAELAGFTFLMVDSSDHITGKTGATVTATRSLDGAAFASCANSVAEVSSGVYKITLAASDMNGDSVTLKFTASGCDTRFITILTQPT